MNNDTDRHCNDLTQLCSREQLSALMDGALPEDQTRFLLRRLQHDAGLAGCWERWRTVADAMRGIAPTRRLPNDFSARVATALLEDVPMTAAARAAVRVAQRRRRRWSGGAALAAAIAVMAIMALPKGESTPDATAAVATTTAPQPAKPASPQTPVEYPQAPASAASPVAASEVAVALVVAAARPERRKATRGTAGNIVIPNVVESTSPAAFAVMPSVPLEATVRPWPRSVLPQYGNGNLAVGLGELPPRISEIDPLATPPRFAAPLRLLKAPKAAHGVNASERSGSDSVHKGIDAAPQP